MLPIGNWRSWLLLTLLSGPILAYMAFGALWLHERGWMLAAGSIWALIYVVFGILAARWTRNQTPVLPPIDWDAPRTFAKVDRDAWTLVEKEADQGELVSLEKLTEIDLYVETGKRLATALARHYHPLSPNPIQTVPVVDVLTALELAAEDLSYLCRQVPGGDMITPEHWKKAVQVAGYFQRANEIYSFLLPIFSPVNGLVRLGTQQLMSKPAWRDMQQNLLRWFFRAYVNRLGTHLIELYSGRLAIGADHYRRLTRQGRTAPTGSDTSSSPPLRIAVAGARGTRKANLVSALEQARSGDLTLLKARLVGEGLDAAMVDRFREARIVEVRDYSATPGGDSARDRTSRHDAVAEAVEADLLILLVDLRLGTEQADAAFARDWDQWFVAHPGIELPPSLAVLTGVDESAIGSDATLTSSRSGKSGSRDPPLTSHVDRLRATLPPSVTQIIPLSSIEPSSNALIANLLPTLLSLLERAERVSLIRHLHRFTNQSKIRRLATQVGKQGQAFLKTIRSRVGGPLIQPNRAGPAPDL